MDASSVALDTELGSGRERLAFGIASPDQVTRSRDT